MRSLILHGHIFKNAGTTLDWALARNFGENFLDHRDDEAMVSEASDCLRDLIKINPSLQAISSHQMPFPLPELGGIELLPLYLLRHPMSRIESVYQFERRQDSDTRGAIAAKRFDFKAYVAWRMQTDVPPTIRNYQCLNISGAGAARSSIDDETSRFAIAADRIANLPLFGVVDRYDESMIVMEAKLQDMGWDNIDLAYKRQNISPQVFLRGNDDPAARVSKDLGELAPQVLEKNRYDLELYQLAQKRLDHEIAEIADFEKKLLDFSARCAELDN